MSHGNIQRHFPYVLAPSAFSSSLSLLTMIKLLACPVGMLRAAQLWNTTVYLVPCSQFQTSIIRTFYNRTTYFQLPSPLKRHLPSHVMCSYIRTYGAPVIVYALGHNVLTTGSFKKITHWPRVRKRCVGCVRQPAATQYIRSHTLPRAMDTTWRVFIASLLLARDSNFCTRISSRRTRAMEVPLKRAIENFCDE